MNFPVCPVCPVCPVSADIAAEDRRSVERDLREIAVAERAEQLYLDFRADPDMLAEATSEVFGMHSDPTTQDQTEHNERARSLADALSARAFVDACLTSLEAAVNHYLRKLAEDRAEAEIGD